MYHIVLNIHIFSLCPEESSTSIIPQLKKTAPMENFEYRFHSFERVDKTSVEDGDILFFEQGAGLDLPSDIRSWCKKGAVLVLCTDTEKLLQLTEEELSILDYVWQMPMTPAVLRFHITRLLQDMRADKNAWLTYSCLEAAMNSVPDLVWVKDIKGAHLKVNESFCKAVGKTMEQVENRGHYYIWDITPEDYSQGEYICLESEIETIKKGSTCYFDENVKTKYGMRKFKTYKTPIFDEDGKTILGTVGVANDVTDYLNTRAELNLLLDSLPMGVLICNTAGKIKYVNTVMKNIFPELSEEMYGKSYEEWKTSCLCNMRENEEEERWNAEVFREEKKVAVSFEETAMKDVFGVNIGSLCLFWDMTRVRDYEKKITYSANNDTLTGLSNRHSFFTQMKEKGTPAAMLFIDIDNFKNVNDQLGHKIGDLAILKVAEAIRETFPEAVCARMGGDEFAIAVYHGGKREILEEKAIKLQSKVNEIILGRKQYPLSVSIGITCIDDASVAIDELIHRSDMAMYAAKRQGKNGYVFY